MTTLPLFADPKGLTSIVGNLLTGITQLVRLIIQKVQQVNANNKQCKTLSERIQRVVANLKSKEFLQKVHFYGRPLQMTLKSFHAFLRECLQFIESFVDASCKQLQDFDNELQTGLSIQIVNKQQDQQDQLEDLHNILLIVNNQQNTMMYLQQSIFQHQQNRFDRLEQVLLQKFDQPKSDKPTTKDDTSTRDIGTILPYIFDKSVSPSTPSVNNFVNGSWSNRYFQYGMWHGPFEHQMTFNFNNKTFEGHGEDNVGQFILSGVFSKETNQIDIIQSYKYGTGNPHLNIGHQCRFRLTWNKEKCLFEGLMYVQYGGMLVPEGAFEMSLIQAA